MATVFPILINGLATTLGGPYTAGSGTATLSAGYGATIAARLAALGAPGISASHPLQLSMTPATNRDAAGQVIDPDQVAVYRATGLSGDTLTGLTVQEGATDRSLSASDAVLGYYTAGDVLAQHAAINALETTSVSTAGTYRDPPWLALTTASVPGLPARLGRGSAAPSLLTDGQSHLDYTTAGLGYPVDWLAFDSRKKMAAAYPTHTIRLRLANLYLAAGLASENGDNPVTYTASVEDSSGHLYRVFWSNGNAAITLAPFGTAVSDPVYVPGLTAGAAFFVRVHTSVGAGQKTPLGTYLDPAAGDLYAINASDQTLVSGTAGYTVPTYGLSVPGVVDVLGAPAAGVSPYFALVGDSIVNGGGESPFPTGSGWASRMLRAASIPFTRVARGGEAMNDVYNFPNLWQTRRRLISGVTGVIFAYGTNDFQGDPLNIIQIQALWLWADLSRCGEPVWAATLPPYTSTTDGWATTANQTPMAQDSVRVGYNTWLRDTTASGAVAQSGGALRGIIDIAAQVEVNAAGVLTTNGGRWPAGATADGVHPNSANHAAMALTLPSSPLGY